MTAVTTPASILRAILWSLAQEATAGNDQPVPIADPVAARDLVSRGYAVQIASAADGRPATYRATTAGLIIASAITAA